MSLFRFIASDNVLPEIDLSGFQKLKVRDIKKITPLPRGPVPWEELDDDVEVLYAADESELGGLHISVCNNPPDRLDDYITRKNVYWLERNIDERWKNQIKEYLFNNIQKGNRIELWSIWFGSGFVLEDKIRKRINFSQINSFDYELLNKPFCCIFIE
ncbi:hypothetical protein LPY66_15315 [Dehalobacter sp. DCM]|uniref:hypothetical protein n=1 Tax=Dehalobacter sp. DCM TaxID=2907827 RepID=UPI0030821F31|nr:hypothetical protein LPY66_15315 [Dehalobacter sp. DCM]